MEDRKILTPVHVSVIHLSVSRSRGRRGLLRPERLLVVSQTFRSLVVDFPLKGLDMEVTHVALWLG
jgi:hypothetical protein